jgi:hypothetical protein
MKRPYATAGVEPSVEEIISDPVMQFILRRDGLTTAEVWAAIDRARGALASRRRISAASGRAPSR